MAPMSSQFMSHSSMSHYMGSMGSMAAGMQQPHAAAFSLGSNTAAATNGIGNSMVSTPSSQPSAMSLL